jgi:phospholipase C
MGSVAHPNDNHPPLAIGWGEEYLRRVYEAAVTSPNRWRKTVLIHYYEVNEGGWVERA